MAYIEETERRRKVAALHGYVPTYLDPAFAQSLPEGHGWQFQGHRNGGLHYVDPATGAESVVPNIWYNQPVDWQVRAARWNADRARERAERLRGEPFPKPWIASDIRQQEEMAARLDRLADEMERRGKVLSIDPITGGFR